MSVSATVLRELHHIHQQLSELHDRLARGPRRVQVREANVAQLDAALAAAQQNVRQTKMVADQKQLELKSGENKIEDLRTKLNGCSSNKEYQALLEQIAASEMANSVLADEILEMLEKSDQLEETVSEAQAHLEAAKNELIKCRDTVSEEASRIQDDIERLEKQLAEVEGGLPLKLKDDYRRVIRGKGAEGMAPVAEGVCGGCGQQITLNMQNQLLLSKPIFCKACGCLLYLSES